MHSYWFGRNTDLRFTLDLAVFVQVKGLILEVPHSTENS